MKPRQAEVPTDSPPPASRGADTYIEVLVNDSRRHPTGTRKTVRARLLKRYPMSVLVELPDGSVVKRRLGRDLPRPRLND
jgi:hypothetical protein